MYAQEKCNAFNTQLYCVPPDFVKVGQSLDLPCSGETSTPIVEHPYHRWVDEMNLDISMIHKEVKKDGTLHFKHVGTHDTGSYTCIIEDEDSLDRVYKVEPRVVHGKPEILTIMHPIFLL